MINEITDPAAWADVRWRSAADGGRKSGPPTTPVYAANCTFPLGSEADLLPGWPATAEKYSLLLQRLQVGDDGTWLCALDFLARELVVEYLVVGATILIMEGPRIVGDGILTRVHKSLAPADCSPMD